MKKIILFCLLLATFIGIVGCENNKGDKIVIAEVTHSVFYAPQYVALSQGFFKKQGLDVEIILTAGADKVMAALISKDADIGLMGPEASVYVYLQGKTDYAVNFAQLTQKDGSFLFGRNRINNFTLEHLLDSEILGGRKAGMPEMSLEYVLKSNGLPMGQDDPTARINVRTDIQFAAQPGAFISGEGDFTTLFEPTASEMEKAGKGYVVASVGAYAGEMAYTCYSTLKSYMTNNPETIEKFTKAIYEAQEWVYSHTDTEVAKSIQKYFIDTPLDILVSSIGRYRAIEAWSHNPLLEESELKHLMDIMMLAGEISSYASFEALVDQSYALKILN